MPRLLPAVLVAATLVVALTACGLTGGDLPEGPDETPTPEETTVEGPTEAAGPPELETLQLTPEGLGTLVIGANPITGDPTDMVVFDPEFCTDARTGSEAGIASGSEFAGLWVPIEQYGSWQPGYSPAEFQVRVENDVLFWILVADEYIPTDEGVRVGDLDDVVTAAYPDAERILGETSELFIVQGTNGKLVIEVARNPPGEDFWPGFDVDRVLVMSPFDNATEPFSLANTGGGPGSCFG